VEFKEAAIFKVIRDYTLEAGLRNLEREFATICRKLARICLLNEGRPYQIAVDEPLVERLLGPRKFTHEVAEAGHRLGVTTGLVWTEFGGELIAVEATLMSGNQQLILTGSLGNVLRESAQTALSYVRSHAAEFSIDAEFFRNSDIHIHIPAGAIPKDGPSAGVTIAMALVSLLTGRPARRDVALTGELTLSGLILPISGVREKILAAQRAGVKTVVFPKKNEVDVNNLEPDITEGVEIVLLEEAGGLADVVLMKAQSR
jgi:ATP-dependent Lon protease